MKVNRHALSLTESEVRTAHVVDVRFDGHRVWSVAVPDAVDGRIVVRWPEAVRKRLSGRSLLTVTRTGTGEVLASADVRFGFSGKRVAFTDKRGQWLAMTKWNRLGPVLEGSSDDVSSRLIASAARLAHDMQSWGYPLYLVGGVLLGMVRRGGLLPHDDDIDFAFLSDETDPAGLGRVSFEMERRLTGAGYTVARHSLAHIELVFFDDDGDIDHYIDVFTGFFHEGLYCQPFALRGEQVRREDLVPTQDILVNGVPLPAPANPEAWLAYAYGENWRIPDPTFKFLVERGTKHRFEAWFGIFNRGRYFWEKHWQAEEDSRGSTAGRQAVRTLDQLAPRHAPVLDLGCGDGYWTQRVAASGHRVVGVDLAFEAVRVARLHNTHGVDFRRVNANDRAALLTLGGQMLESGENWSVLISDVLHGLTQVNRKNVYLFLKMVLRGDGVAVVSFDTHRTSRYKRADPRTWHYPVRKFKAELATHGLRAVSVRKGVRRSEVGWRRYATATVQAMPHRQLADDLWQHERDEDVS